MFGWDTRTSLDGVIRLACLEIMSELLDHNDKITLCGGARGLVGRGLLA